MSESNDSSGGAGGKRCFSSVISSDSCTINNGGCDENSICTHDAASNAVRCACKTGYVNTGCPSNVVCTGNVTCRDIVEVDERERQRLTCVTLSDGCKVKKGRCPVNSVCSHDGKTNAVVCTCVPGFTNTGTNSSAVCQGKRDQPRTSLEHLSQCFSLSDSCQINNGGCNANAACSHDPSTNAIRCTCNSGYTNTGSSSKVICTGNVHCRS